jgi:phosphatidylserine/phosphatidylglycerophosphate/cardiolipin synthase-like enzyme
VVTKLKVYANEDDALLFWSVSQAIKKCRGFAIERRLKDPQGHEDEDFLPNRMGFENEVVPKPPAGEAVTKPSTEWPFQRFSWTDHDADTGDTVSYRVIPIVRNDAGKLKRVQSEASEWSPERTLGTASDSNFRPFFNRGFVISQFMARFLADKKLTLAQFKNTIKDQDDKTIRRFLSGDLRLALINELRSAAKDKTDVFAALFEMSDDELIDELCALGGKAHVVLANGSIKPAPGETSAQARKRDGNKEARAKLEAAGADIEPDNRFISPGALGHNKFFVRTGKDGKPKSVWTGSTNWSPTGLCTQVNNGILIEDPKVAAVYLQQWKKLRGAGSTFPKTLVTGNSKPILVGTDSPGNVRTTVWFTKTQKEVDLEALKAEVEAAKEGILFLMFMPGLAGLFSTVAARSAEPGLYVRGVVSDLPKGPGDESEVEVNLIDGGTHRPMNLDVIQPAGVAHPFANFAAEVTRNQFKANIGHAIIHSKVIVIDPFSADPTVITGSHNFSISASGKNDENFLIIKGDPELAEAYAVNILGAYSHYRWRSFIGHTKKPFNGLKDNDRWMVPMMANNRRDLRFWGV